jgi:bifunctional DNA-binding transcriptional regulator/antitoxin component of YhaV-PrlF toxin-antitoxin module
LTRDGHLEICRSVDRSPAGGGVGPREGGVSVVKLLRGGRLTLPAEAWRALRLEEDDDLLAEVVEGRIVLKPVAVVGREEAWRRLRRARAAVRYTGSEPRPSPEEEERWILDALKDDGDRRA